MKLPEYKAKEVFEKFGMPVMKGVVIDSLECMEEKMRSAGLSFPVVIKAQIQAGGRGKAGGIKFANSTDEAKAICEKLLFSELKGLKVNQLLIVEKASPQKEWYVSIMMDRASKMPLAIFSAQGGVDIEETAKILPDKIIKVNINPFRGVKDYTIDYIAGRSGIGREYAAQLKDVIQRLYQVFMEYDCLLAEINPLVIDAQGKMIALDGKIDIDDSALFRLPDIADFRDRQPEEDYVKEAGSFGFLYIPVESQGSIAVMSNGSGMIMSCIDLIVKNGMSVGAALDLGGGATAERIKEAVRIVLSKDTIDTLFISIFGGITRCDEVARGIASAMAGFKNKRVVVRMEGTNKQEGLSILSLIEGDIVSVGSIPEGAAALCGRGMFQ